MTSWRAVVAICFVFVLGMVAGAFVTAIGYERGMRRFFVQPQGQQAMVLHRLMMRKLTNELALDQNQSANVQNILFSAEQKIQEARKTIRPEVLNAIQSARTEIRAQLRPDQTKKFDQLVAKSRKMEVVSQSP